MKMYRLIAALSLFFLLFAMAAFADEALYVQPFRARIFTKASISSNVLGTVDSGFQFVATGREGSWLKLNYNGKPGFIPAVQTAKSPPLGKSAVQGGEATQKLGSRSRTSATAAVVAGMKGLTYEDRARITKGERSNLEALEKVETLKIMPEELAKFQAEGGKR